MRRENIKSPTRFLSLSLYRAKMGQSQIWLSSFLIFNLLQTDASRNIQTITLALTFAQVFHIQVHRDGSVQNRSCLFCLLPRSRASLIGEMRNMSPTQSCSIISNSSHENTEENRTTILLGCLMTSTLIDITHLNTFPELVARRVRRQISGFRYEKNSFAGRIPHRTRTNKSRILVSCTSIGWKFSFHIRRQTPTSIEDESETEVIYSESESSF